MRLIVKQKGRTINELRFSEGPIYIGRHEHSQVFLPDRAVSRQHAVIFTTADGKWMLEDLDSPNKTYLNDKAIHKAEIKSGDLIRIADFIIEIHLEADVETNKAIQLEDTLVTTSPKPQIIIRKPDAEHAPDIKLPARRAKDFLDATEAICKAGGPDEMLKTLLSIVINQFGASRVWCALRNEPKGPMASHTGKTSTGEKVELNDIKLGAKITQAVEKAQFLLLPQVPEQMQQQGVCSAMIAPIMDPDGCFGVIYLDNGTDQQPYTLSDLDYLMILAIHTAAILENF
jgi:pSer/pThr/pTyr-binding forkhead associated (FHA) protein